MKTLIARLRAQTNRLGQCAGSGQCSKCGGVFPDWNGGVCDACKDTDHA